MTNRQFHLSVNRILIYRQTIGTVIELVDGMGRKIWRHDEIDALRIHWRRASKINGDSNFARQRGDAMVDVWQFITVSIKIIDKNIFRLILPLLQRSLWNVRVDQTWSETVFDPDLDSIMSKHLYRTINPPKRIVAIFIAMSLYNGILEWWNFIKGIALIFHRSSIPLFLFVPARSGKNLGDYLSKISFLTEEKPFVWNW